ncbi:MAG: nuclear transport factor 2 family protein [Novosphingobium sp.]|nr:nuclear transport factor 2 family protein [Novosphingobium sp.]
MTETEQLAAIEAIKQAKAKYFRGVDTSDAALVRSVLAENCVLDYRGCCTDPDSGRDYLPQMNTVMEGRDSWPDGGMKSFGIVSTHHGHLGEVTVTGPDSASAIWPMTDRLYLPEGAEYAVMIGHGYYHETYVKRGGAWQIQTLRIQRIRVEGH